MSRGKVPARMLTRACILLKANQGEGGVAKADAAIAGASEIHPTTVAHVCRRFAEQGLAITLARQGPDRVYVISGCACGFRERCAGVRVSNRGCKQRSSPCSTAPGHWIVVITGVSPGAKVRKGRQAAPLHGREIRYAHCLWLEWMRLHLREQQSLRLLQCTPFCSQQRPFLHRLRRLQGHVALQGLLAFPV